MTRLRLAFLGSPGFAVPALDALHDAGHEIRAVYTQTPRPAGRGQRPVACPVHVRADALGLAVRNPVRLRRDEAEWAHFAALDLDAAVVAAYGLILPRPMLEAPRRGCLNIHASLLPRWRGAAPIQAAILAGDAETGITIMQMDEGVDTGPALLREAIPIGPRDTTPMLQASLAAIGAKLMLRALAGPVAPTAQPEQGVTTAPKLLREDGIVDWARDAGMIDRQVRALTPWPGTVTTLEAPGGGAPARRPPEPLKILAATAVGAPRIAVPGTVLDGALTIACGTGALRLERVQLAGRPALDTDAFLRGRPVPPGTVLGAPAR